MSLQGPGRTGIATKFELSGPLFRPNPGQTVRRNIREFQTKLAEYAQERGRSMIGAKAGAMPHYSGHTRARTIGRTRAEVRRGGKVWATTLVVSANTDGMGRSEAIRTKAAMSSIEGRFRVYRALKYIIRAKMRAIDFTKGLD